MTVLPADAVDNQQARCACVQRDRGPTGEAAWAQGLPRPPRRGPEEGRRSRRVSCERRRRRSGCSSGPGSRRRGRLRSEGTGRNSGGRQPVGQGFVRNRSRRSRHCGSSARRHDTRQSSEAGGGSRRRLGRPPRCIVGLGRPLDVLSAVVCHGGSDMSEIASGSPLPRQAPEGTSFFAFLFGVWFFLLTAFFVVSLLAIVSRSQPVSGRTDSASTSPGEVQEPPTPTPRSPTFSQVRRAIVTVPAAMKNGNVRTEPRADAPIVGRIPGGEVVEMGECRTVQGKTRLEVWCRVRGTAFGQPVEGWMHSDILRKEEP